MAIYYFSWVEGRLVQIDDKYVETCRVAGVDVIELIPKQAGDDLATLLDQLKHNPSRAHQVPSAIKRYHKSLSIVDDLPNPN